jgi:hypothetical protein
MDDHESPSRMKWECKYQVVFIPKCRRKTLYGELRRHLGEVTPQPGDAEGEQDRGGASHCRGYLPRRAQLWDRYAEIGRQPHRVLPNDVVDADPLSERPLSLGKDTLARDADL